MKERNMTVIRAKEQWVQELALQVFDIDELASDFKCIKTFDDAWVQLQLYG